MANGDKVTSVGFCSAIPFVIEGNTFVADFLVIPLAGFDLVLGIKWLQQLGPILWDFQSLTMSFTQDHHQLTLHGTHAQPHCTLQTITAQHPDRDHLPTLLTKFADLFQEPTALPPIRACDHRIRLKMGTKPVVVRPYRYPHLKKDEIE
ncbi:uncharacterized protein [Aristolochia californica]|uniref:uncharacterized protein n=1 Tax=Aristolochia californica TaxID=171875 RepID=UPI0035D67657